MPDNKLAVLVGIIVVLSLGHDIDHIVRGDFRWSLAGSAPVFAVLLTKYAILGFGLYFYLRNKIGPLFWAIVAGISVVLAWLAHFSPFSEQTPQSIYRAYATPAGGAVAVCVLALLMLTLIATTVYSQYLWARQSK
jgi:amino acid transporter